MPDISSNLGLNLPKGTDFFDYDVHLRQNFQKIDDQLKSNIIKTYTAAAGQTLVTLDHPYTLGTGALNVEVDGVPQFVGSGYTETSTTSITFTEALLAGQVIKVTILGLVPANDVRFNALDELMADRVTDTQGRGYNIKFPPTPLVGAKGDGVVDDTVAIQAMINYINSNGGGKLFIPNGTFIVSPDVSGNCLYPCSNLTIEGNGYSSIIKLKNGVNFNGLIWANTTLNNFEMHHVHIDDNRANNNTMVPDNTNNHQISFFASACNNINIHHCFFDCSGINAIQINSTNAQNIKVKDNIFHFEIKTGVPYYDNTCVYLDAIQYENAGNTYYSTTSYTGVNGATSAFECHGGPADAHDNIVVNFLHGTHIVSKGGTTTNDGFIKVHDNHYYNVQNGVELWAVSDLKHISIRDNHIYVNQVDRLVDNFSGIFINSSPSYTGNIKDLIIKDNMIKYQVDTSISTPTLNTAINAGISMIIGAGLLSEVLIDGNEIVNSPCGGIMVGGSIGTYNDFSVKNNKIINSGNTNRAGATTDRAGIITRGTISNAKFDNNTVSDNNATFGGYYPYYFGSGTYKNVKFLNNEVFSKQGGYYLWPAVNIPSGITVSDYAFGIKKQYSLAMPLTSGDYFQGDLIWDKGALTPGTSNVGYWIFGQGTSDANPTSLTGVSTGGNPNSITMTGNVAQLRPGNSIKTATWGSSQYTILTISGQTVTVNGSPAVINGDAITFAAPSTRGFGVLSST